MKTDKTKAIVLSRTNYHEADRIINFITLDQGKLALIAKGSRKPKSKLASGIEIFSVTNISYIKGCGEVGTLISAKPEITYDKIVSDINRVQCGYDLIKLLNRNTEHHADSQYFLILKQAFEALNDPEVSHEFAEIWSKAQLLKVSGHMPNLLQEEDGSSLDKSKKYNFNVDSMCLSPAINGRLNADAIKSLRLLFSNNSPMSIIKITGFDKNLVLINSIIKQMAEYYLI
jgi:DNA repair protein RecO